VSGDLLAPDPARPTHEFLTTGEPEQFQRLAELFFGGDIRDLGVRQVRLEAAWS
jgi:hypothetical protein